MKNLTKMALVASALTLNLFAADDTTDFHIGASSAEVLGQSYTEYNIGYGVDFYTQKSIYIGLSFDIAYGNVDLENSKKSADVYSSTADLKLGYALFDNTLAIYGLGTGALQSVNNLEGAGFGYGGGVDYKINKNFAINVEYKTYDMVSNAGDYTYEKINSNIKYTF
jgi:opacity protein-like surface antigen